MKNVFLILMLAIILFVFGYSSCAAHSGRTDGNGGHWDYSEGEYHYHHGHEAHKHPNGVCPYSTDYEKADNDQSADGTYDEHDKKQENGLSSGWAIGIASVMVIGAGAFLVWKKNADI